jgi:hypothetical protein
LRGITVPEGSLRRTDTGRERLKIRLRSGEDRPKGGQGGEDQGGIDDHVEAVLYHEQEVERYLKV